METLMKKAKDMIEKLDFPLFIRVYAFVSYPHLSVDNVENSILRTYL